DGERSKNNETIRASFDNVNRLVTPRSSRGSQGRTKVAFLKPSQTSHSSQVCVDGVVTLSRATHATIDGSELNLGGHQWRCDGLECAQCNRRSQWAFAHHNAARVKTWVMSFRVALA